MQEFITQNPLLALVLVVIGLVIITAVLFKFMQYAGFERIRGVVYKAFVYAENHFLHGDNDSKFEYVVEEAIKAVPSPFNFFITEELLRDVVQAWFDLCKDLLDDGKLNKSKELK